MGMTDRCTSIFQILKSYRMVVARYLLKLKVNSFLGQMDPCFFHIEQNI